MDPLLAARQPDQKHPLWRVVIHADNAHIHTSKIADEYLESHRVLHADHPLYSPDLAPSDFFLFEFIKGQLKGTHFPDGQVLRCEVRWILLELPPEMLRSTFDAWMDRLERCATIGGGHIKG
jgi:hypothetical protein